MRIYLGTTSSGKSTLINAMMGTPLLPTSHNVTTSTLCEIKYGPRKEAVLHFETSAEEKLLRSVETLDLQKESDRKRFAAAIKSRGGEEKRVKKAEVFAPFQFLEVFSEALTKSFCIFFICRL